MTDAPLPDDAAAFLTERIGEGWSVRPLAGDASVRRYFRVALPDGSTQMLAWYPEEVRPQLKRFLDAYHAVVAHGRIPQVVHFSDSAVLQHDVGDRTIFDILHEEPAEGPRLYRAAVDALVAFQRANAGEINPPFTAAFFFNELEMARQFFVEMLMQVPHEESNALVPLFQKLTENISSHPYILCHRDFHGQNLHLFNGHLYVIDYQDMRTGPDTYDLASLLRDRGVARFLGEEAEMELVDYYATLSGEDVTPLRTRYFETLLQRSIKILGTFSRQPIERGRLHYLEFIPATLESIERCLRELPEFAALRRLLPSGFDLVAATTRVKGMLHGSTQDHAPAR